VEDLRVVRLRPATVMPLAELPKPAPTAINLGNAQSLAEGIRSGVPFRCSDTRAGSWRRNQYARWNAGASDQDPRRARVIGKHKQTGDDGVEHPWDDGAEGLKPGRVESVPHHFTTSKHP
jgi:hypothetical protein